MMLSTWGDVQSGDFCSARYKHRLPRAAPRNWDEMTGECRSMMRLNHVAKPDQGLLPTRALVIALLLGAALVRPAGAQVLQPLDLVKQAVEAVGGIDALRSLKRNRHQGGSQTLGTGGVVCGGESLR